MVLGVRTHPFATSRSNTPEALETMHQPTSFRLSLPSGSEMTMMRWVSGIPEHFLIHIQGAIHAIKEIELDTKFQEAMRAVKSEILEVNLAKMTYKEELKKGKVTMLPSRQLELARPLPTRPKSSRRQRVTISSSCSLCS